jgi:Mce-associated membrane protein
MTPDPAPADPSTPPPPEPVAKADTRTEPAPDADTPTADEPKPNEPKPVEPTQAATPAGRAVSIRLGTLVRAGVTAVLVVLLGVAVGVAWDARSTLSDRDAAAAEERHAEQVATDYAVGASTVNFADLSAWQAKLKANTTGELAGKFDATAPKLADILVPLKWTSTANPIAAKVISHNGGIYKVDVFLDVDSTSAQTPDGGRTTVTYNVTLDRDSGWKVSDVGGMDVGAGAAPLPTK